MAGESGICMEAGKYNDYIYKAVFDRCFLGGTFIAGKSFAGYGRSAGRGQRVRMALKQIAQACDVHCVTGWTLLDSRWNGIPMKTIIDLVKVKDGVGFVIFEAPGASILA